MAILCPYCKTTLERDDARFCQNCGRAVLARPQPASTPGSTTPSGQQPPIKQAEQNKAGLRVQIVSQPEKRRPPLQEQAIQPPEQSQPVLREQVAKQPAQNRQAIRVQVVKQPEENRQEENASQVEPGKPALHVQVVKSPEQESSAWQEQVAFQPPPQPRRSSQPGEDFIGEDKQSSLADAHPARAAMLPGAHDETEEDAANTLRAAQEAAQIKGTIKRDDGEVVQAGKIKQASEEKKIDAAPKIPGAPRTKFQINNAVSWPEPMTHVSTTGQPAREQGGVRPEPEQKKSSPTPPPRTDPPVRELRVKVWDQSTVVSPVPVEVQRDASVHKEVPALDELPTTPPADISWGAGPLTDEEESV